MLTRRALLFSAVGAATTSFTGVGKGAGIMATTNFPLAVRATVQANGTNAGDPSSILIDGSAVPVTANGVAGYLPASGDRLLVQSVGGVVEVVQFLTKTMIVGQTIKTAPTGARIEITEGSVFSFGNVGLVKFYSGDVYETDAVSNPGMCLLGGSVASGSLVGENIALTSGGMTDGAGHDVVGGTSAFTVPNVSVESTYDTTTHKATTNVTLTAGGTASIAVIGDTDATIPNRIDVRGDVTRFYSRFNVGGISGGDVTALNWNISTVTLDASGNAVISHGLGAAPTLVLASSTSSGNDHCGPITYTSTTFVIHVVNVTTGAVVTGSRTIRWLAIR